MDTWLTQALLVTSCRVKQLFSSGLVLRPWGGKWILARITVSTGCGIIPLFKNCSPNGIEGLSRARPGASRAQVGNCSRASLQVSMVSFQVSYICAEYSFCLIIYSVMYLNELDCEIALENSLVGL